MPNILYSIRNLHSDDLAVVLKAAAEDGSGEETLYDGVVQSGDTVSDDYDATGAKRTVQVDAGDESEDAESKTDITEITVLLTGSGDDVDIKIRLYSDATRSWPPKKKKD